jgi:hypothetical protein
VLKEIRRTIFRAVAAVAAVGIIAVLFYAGEYFSERAQAPIRKDDTSVIYVRSFAPNCGEPVIVNGKTVGAHRAPCPPTSKSPHAQ